MERATNKSLSLSPVAPVASEATCGLTVCANPFSVRHELHVAPVGLTIAELLGRVNIPARVWDRVRVTLDGRCVELEDFYSLQPREGSRIGVQLLPKGGGDTNLLRSMLFVAVAVAATYATPWATSMWTGNWGGTAFQLAITQAGLTVLGVLAVNALIPVSGPKSDSGDEISRSLSITGGSNAFKPFSTMPNLLGRHKIFPLYASKPYTELVGRDVYLRLLFVASYKNLVIDTSTMKLGETLLSEYTDVEYEVDTEWGHAKTTLASRDVDEEEINLKLLGPIDPVVRTTSEDAVEFSLDLSAPAGLLRIDASGDQFELNLFVEVSYKLTSEPDTSYLLVESVNFKAQGPEPIRLGVHFIFPGGAAQYDIKVRRTSYAVGPGNGTDQVYVDDLYYNIFRSFKATEPVLHPDAALLALRIKATDQLSGSISDFSFVAQSKLLALDVDSQVENYCIQTDMQGAVLGTISGTGIGDGRFPTGWQFIDNGVGLTFFEITDVGCEHGLDYIELELTITNTSGASVWANIIFHTNLDVAEEQLVQDVGEYSKSSCWFKHVGGAVLGGVNSIALYNFERTLPTTTPAGYATTVAPVHTGELEYLEAIHGVAANGNYTHAALILGIAAGQSISGYKFRIYTPQHRVSAGATDPAVGIVVNPTQLPYTGDTWTFSGTSNPAALYRAVLQGIANARPLMTSRLDLEEIEDWYKDCVTEGRTFNMYRDFTAGLYDTLRDIAQAGRARPSQIDGYWTVIRDVPQVSEVDVVSEVNSYGFNAVKLYPDVVHGFRIRFKNEDEDWIDDERIVYDDGYSDSNASKFAALEFPGVTDPNQIWKDGRYHIAVIRLRPESFMFSMDVEHLPILPGNMIRFQQQTILVGLGAGRVVSVTTSGSDIVSLTVDNKFPMMLGPQYVARVRTVDGSSSIHQVATQAGYNSSLIFMGTLPLVTQILVGDLIVFGEEGLETMNLIVGNATPGNDMSMNFKCYNEAPGVHIADQGEIPPHETFITMPIGIGVPVIINIASDESVLVRASDGSLQPRILVTFGFVNNRENVDLIEVQYQRTSDVMNWVSLPTLTADAVMISIMGVYEGVSYSIRSRFKFIDGGYGPWSPVIDHTVIGKLSPPPDVDVFLVERQPDGTREFSWELWSPPPDLIGFRIKYKLGTSGADWDTNMIDMLDGSNVRRSIAEGLVGSSPWETNQLAAGDYQIAIKAVDDGGRESVNALFITSSLGDPRIKNALYVIKERSEGWLGTKTDCYVEADTGYLVPSDTTEWDDLATEVDDWDDWTSWNLNPATLINYQWPQLDIGAVVAFDPLVTLITDATSYTIEEQHSDNNVDWSSWTVVGGAVSARYLRIRIAVTNPTLSGVKEMQTIISADTIEEELVDIDIAAAAGCGNFRIPITKSYTMITTVQLALQSVGSGWTWEINDKHITLGPEVTVYDGASIASSAFTYDAVIKGF